MQLHVDRHFRCAGDEDCPLPLVATMVALRNLVSAAGLLHQISAAVHCIRAGGYARIGAGRRRRQASSQKVQWQQRKQWESLVDKNSGTDATGADRPMPVVKQCFRCDLHYRALLHITCARSSRPFANLLGNLFPRHRDMPLVLKQLFGAE